MKSGAHIWVVLAAGACLLAGCNDTASRPAQVRAPAPTPTPVATPSYATEPLPVPPRTAAATDKNFEKRPAIDVLVAGVQAVYDAGQAQLQARHRDQAQEKFDLAADMILKSGFPADYSPERSNLSYEMGEAAQSSDLTAANTAGSAQDRDEEESETPAEPAPIDE